METMERHYRALELDKVLAMLASHATCEDSRKQALALRPMTDFEEVRREMAMVGDANSLTNRYGTPTVLDMKNCDGPLRRAEMGSSLSLRELLDVCHVLKAIRNLASWKRQSQESETSLDYLFSNLFPNRPLEDRLESAILSEEEIADNASPELAQIRRKIRSTQTGVRTQLDKMIKSPTYAKFLQEQIVTMRDGRFVVPVKSEHRGEIRGLVHDTSSSGATVFVEPMAVVEANNEIRVLQSKEKQEIDRVIAKLSAEVGQAASAIKHSYDVAVELDLLFAKSRLADRMKASVPALNQEGRVNLIKARHPLIDPDKIVPIDLNLGLEFDTLVITGPNTGGKTVALKTLGLLTLMAMCGLMIPAAEGSALSVFDKVLADIGDEQSIEQSLSTFSAHMTNIIDILDKADSSTLVLIDELGAGTDPVEGAALAVSIIEKLRSLGAKVVSTTHYAEIKMYALQTEGVENASCEFDVATLRPTYRLLIGVPGRSNAFAISERLGLTGDVIDRAKELISSDNTRFEDVVSELEAARQGLEKERSQASILRAQAERTHKEMEEYRQKLEKDAEREIEKARAQARSIVEQVKFQAELVMEEIEELKKQKNSADIAQLASKAKAQYRSQMKKLQDMADPVTGRKRESSYRLPRQLKRGDLVIINELNKEGTVLSDPDSSGNVMVQAGILKTRVPVGGLRLIEDQEKKKITYNGGGKSGVSYRDVKASAGRDAKTEVDLRGMTTDEALLELDQYLDGAVLAGLNTVTIIHGKGTGALRAAVHQHLRKHKAVRTFRLGVYGEGESGVTIAELK